MSTWEAKLPDVEQRVAFVFVARSPIARLIEAKKARGWTRHRIYSDPSGDYTREYVSKEDADAPGYSVFTRRDASIPTFPRISLAFASPIPWMYCSPTTTRLAVGMLTPAIRAKVPTPSKTYGALMRARHTFRWPRKSARL